MPSEIPSKNLQLPAVIEASPKGVVKAWKWTKTRRQAARYIVQGWSDTRIGTELGIHRLTVGEWRKRPEFMTYVIDQARDYVSRRRFQRVQETGTLTDQLFAETLRRMNALAKNWAGVGPDGQPVTPTPMIQAEVNAMATFLREYREFRGQERADFGDDIKRFEGVLRLSTMLPDAPAEHGALGGAQSFQAFLSEHAAQLPQRALASGNPQQALIEATRSLVRSTPILDALAKEDEEVEATVQRVKDNEHR